MSLLASVLFPAQTEACSCVGGGTTYRGCAGASAVFVGTVRSRTSVTETRTYTVLGRGAEQRPEPMYEFTLSVDEAFKGAEGKRLAIRTATSDAACGVGFVQGKTYLVFASQGKDGTYYAHMCSRTRSVENAASDLAILRLAAAPNTVTRLQGRVTQHLPSLSERDPQHPHEPMRDLRIDVRGADRSWQEQTDQDGQFAIEGLPRGRYAVEPQLPAGFHLTRDRSGFVDIGGCGPAEVEFVAATDPPLLGVVRGPDGAPVVGAKVTAFRIERESPRVVPVIRGKKTVETRPGGAWRFDGLPAGSYVVGVNVVDAPRSNASFAPFYYSSAASWQTATVLNVSSVRPAWLELRSGPALVKRTLSVLVVDEAGAPIPGATLFVRDLGPPAYYYSLGGRTDANGRVTEDVLEGRRYEVTASKQTRYPESDPVTVEASGDVRSVRLVLKQSPR